MIFSNYSYLTFAVVGADNRVLRSFGNIDRLQHLIDPSALFLNAPEVFGFVKSNGLRQISLWSEGQPTVTVGIAEGADVDAEAVLKLLREGWNISIPPRDLFAQVGLRPDVPDIPSEGTGGEDEPNLPLTSRGMVTYLSSADLVNLIDTLLRTDNVKCELLLAVQATAVPVGEGAFIPRVTVTTVGLYDFGVTPAPNHHPAPEKKPRPLTLQEIEDEIEQENAAELAPPRRRRGRGVFVILAVVALVAGWAAVRYLPGLMPNLTPYAGMEHSDVSVSPEEEPRELIFEEPEVVDTLPVGAADTLNLVVSPDGTSAVPAEAPVVDTPEMTPSQFDAENADAAYLNAHTVWHRSELKSDKYRAFFDSFAEGNIKAIAEADYFAVEGKATNRTALKLIDMMWQAYRSPTQHSNEQQLRKLKGESKIDITALYDRLSRYRDANPNKSPRPRR